MYFVAPDELCQLNSEKYKSLIKRCFLEPGKKNDENILKLFHKNNFWNMEMKMAHPFANIINLISDTANLMMIFGHLVTGIQILRKSSLFVLMDIKPDNLLFRVHNHHLHPVFIDFSSDHVIQNVPSDWKRYVTSFAKLYHTWTPEVKMLIERANNPTIDYDGIVRNIRNWTYRHYMKKLKKQSSVNEVIPWYSKDQTAQLSMYLSHSVDMLYKIMENQQIKKWELENFAEKNMIWEIANLMFRYLPDKKFFDSKMFDFYKLLSKQIHPDVNQRLNCYQCLAELDSILRPVRMDYMKYMIPITKKMVREFKHDEKLRKLVSEI